MPVSKNRIVQPPRGTDSPSTESTPSDLPGGGELDRVRDILFGQHARTLEETIARLEGRMEERIENLRQDMSDLELRLIERIESISGQGKERLTEAVGGLREDLESRHTELAAAIEEQIRTLKGAKLDREALAKLLGGLAEQLGNSTE